MAKTVEKESIVINESVLENIKKSLSTKYPSLIVDGLLNKDSREELKDIVRKEHKGVLKDNEDLINYIVQEIVGTGVIEEIINNDDTVTDIGYNGRVLKIQSNDYKKTYDGLTKITDEYIVRIIQKFANAVGKDFTPKEPILDAVYGNIRLNAVHGSRNPKGHTTMSMRIVRPRLALNMENFTQYAPKVILDFFSKAILLKENMVICGESGTGKTETHKLLLSFVNDEDKIILVEDVPETFATELFPEKDIYSWVTKGTTTINDFVKATLRHAPVWAMVTETRGKEAYELYQAVLSGAHIITSLHAVNCRAVPRRFVNMAKMGYQVDEVGMIEDIRRYFGFGLHNKAEKINGKVVRYLSEIVAYDIEGDKTVFEQEIVGDKFITRIYDFPQEFKRKLKNKGIDISLLEEFENKEMERAIF